jgi:hypothetical protein
MADIKDAKDVTSEAFGLLIAYLIPGVVGFISMSFWSETVKRALQTFPTEQANANLLLLVLIASLAIGLLAAAVRGLVFELLLPLRRPNPKALTDEEFASLSDPNKFAAFRAAVDAHYRYHQCWGALTMVLPVQWLGWMREKVGSVSARDWLSATILFVFFELVVAWAARDAYKKYIQRARKILT